MRRECDVEAGERKWIEGVTGCGHGGQVRGKEMSSCLMKNIVLRKFIF
jgi:hypothetical protein